MALGDPPPPGVMHLHDRVETALAAGEYDLLVTQAETTLQGQLPGTSTALGDTPGVGSRLIVDGPRLWLDPAEVEAVHPPRGASGQFTQVLPHIVLRRRTLPWERRAGTDKQTPRPWLALLVLAEGEGGARIERRQPLNVRLPDVAAQLGVTSALPVDLLHLDRQVALQVLPHPRELDLLAHVRRVGSVPSDPGADPDGWFAVVVANRLPQLDVRNIVCLVSLEARDDLVAANSQEVSLIVLHDWSFSCVDQGGTFRDLVEALQAAPFGATESMATRDALNVEIPSRSRAGVPGRVLYRGPLRPDAPEDPILELSTTAADLRRPLPDRMGPDEDISEAAAFELGRLLALANESYCQALMSGRARGRWALELVPPTFDVSKLIEMRDMVLGREAMYGLAESILDKALDGVISALPPAVDPGALPRGPLPRDLPRLPGVRDPLDPRLGKVGIEVDRIEQVLGKKPLLQKNFPIHSPLDDLQGPTIELAPDLQERLGRVRGALGKTGRWPP